MDQRSAYTCFGAAVVADPRTQDLGRSMNEKPDPDTFLCPEGGSRALVLWPGSWEYVELCI